MNAIHKNLQRNIVASIGNVRQHPSVTRITAIRRASKAYQHADERTHSQRPRGISIRLEYETIAKPPSFPRTRALQRTARPSKINNDPVIPADAGASADGTSIQNQQRPRHSRGRGNPESTTHAFSPNPGNNHRPFRSQEMYESLTRNHWRSAARVLQWSLNTPMPKEHVVTRLGKDHHQIQENHPNH